VVLPVELATSLQRLPQPVVQQHRKRSLQLVVPPVELATSKSSTPNRKCVSGVFSAYTAKFPAGILLSGIF
jgi:hypothetical protein